jgi:bacterioferritin-associated ferredoxin
MIICSCNAISDTTIKASLESEMSPRTPSAVYRCLGCRPNCGRCYATVRTIIDAALKQAGAARLPLADAKNPDERHLAPAPEAAACTSGCAGCTTQSESHKN